jgi:hypothetical protein
VVVCPLMKARYGNLYYMVASAESKLHPVLADVERNRPPR